MRLRGCPVYGVTQAEHTGLLSVTVLVPTIIGLALLAACLIIERPGR